MGIDVRRAAAACACLAMLATSGTALGSANNKKGNYDSHGEASSGFRHTVELDEETALTVRIGESSSEGDVEKHESGTSASDSSGGTGVSVGEEVGVGSESTCGPVTGTDNAGVARAEDADAALDVPAGPARVRVLWSECTATATQANNAHPSASSGVLRVDVADVASVSVLEGTSGADPTSGQSNASAGFSVLAVNDLVVLGCTADSTDTNGADSDGESVIVAGTAAPIEDCPVVDSTASHSRA
jgi:hypothetical protein